MLGSVKILSTLTFVTTSEYAHPLLVGGGIAGAGCAGCEVVGGAADDVVASAIIVSAMRKDETLTYHPSLTTFYLLPATYHFLPTKK